MSDTNAAREDKRSEPVVPRGDLRGPVAPMFAVAVVLGLVAEVTTSRTVRVFGDGLGFGSGCWGLGDGTDMAVFRLLLEVSWVVVTCAVALGGRAAVG